MAKRSAALNIIFGADSRQLDRALGETQKKLRNLAGDMKSLGSSMSLGLTAPIAALGASSVKTFSEFEYAMAKVKAVSGATAGEFQSLENQAKDLGRSTIFTASQVAGLQLEYSKLGFSSGEITKVTEATLNLAQATDSDLSQAAEVAGSTLRAFGLDAAETSRITDVMAASFSATALDMGSFQESMKYVAPVAKAAGISIEETTAMLGALANNGIKGSQAGTALRRVISELGSTGGDVAGAIRNLSAEGLNLADAKDEVGRSAQTALLVLSESMGVVGDLTSEFEGAEGAAKRMSDTMNDSAKGSIAAMNSALEGAAIVIGEALAPIVTTLADKVAALALAFSELSPTAQGAIMIIAGIAAAIGPVLIIIGSMISAYGNLKIALEAFRVSQLRANLAALANPYVAIAAGIAVAVGAIALYVAKVNEGTEAEKRLASAQKRAEKSYIQEAGKVNALAAEFRLLGDDMETRKRVIEDLQKISPSYFGNLNAEKTTYEDLKAAVDGYNNSLRQQAIQKAFGDELLEIETERVRIAEELRKANLAVAQSEENLRNAQENRQVVSANGETNVDRMVRALNRQLAIQRDLQAEEAELAEASAEIGEALKFATDQIAKGSGNAENSVSSLLARLEGSPLSPNGDAEPAPLLTTITDLRLRGKELENQISDLQSQAAGGIGIDIDHLRDLQKELGEIESALEDIGVAMNPSQRGAAAPETITPIGISAIGTGQEIGRELIISDSTQEAIQAAIDNTTDRFQIFSESIYDILTGLAENVTIAFGEMIGSVLAGEQTLGQGMAGIGTIIGDAMQSLGKMAIEIGKISIFTGGAIEGIKKALQTLNPYVAVAAGVALIALGKFVTAKLSNAGNSMGSGVPAFAEGGMVTGKQLAWVGDNPSGKEAIIPFEKMGRFLEMAGAKTGSQTIEVKGILRGSDIHLSNRRAAYDYNRTRG